MNRRTPVIAAAALGGGVLLALAAPLAASAHVGVTPSGTAAGSYSVLTFAVPHGCEGSPTTVVAIDIPEGVLSVTPTINPGWTVEKVVTTLDEPETDAHGNSITERVSQVVYTAKTPLADGYRDTFALQLPLPADAAGETLLFPVTQTCEVGVTEWNEETPEGGEEPEHPAPAITVTEAAGDEHGHGAEAESDEHEDAAASEDAASQPDVLARVLGIAGLVVGTVGIVVAVVARRSRTEAK
ncbi:MAG: YcnI family protein [Leifsonia sp.]